MARIVVAFGGNALGNNPKEQQALIKKSVKDIVTLIKDRHEIVISHGNGPQVGVINLAFEDSYENKDIPYMPFPECTAMSQGYIGYHLQKGLRDLLEDEGIEKKVITLVTQVVVDKTDPSFKNPTKPVGPFYSEKMAKELMEQTGEKYIEDAGRGYREDLPQFRYALRSGRRGDKAAERGAVKGGLLLRAGILLLQAPAARKIRRTVSDTERRSLVGGTLDDRTEKRRKTRDSLYNRDRSFRRRPGSAAAVFPAYAQQQRALLCCGTASVPGL